MNRPRLLALAGAAAGVAAGVTAERLAVRRRRRNDPEAAEQLGQRRGVRSRTIELADGARIFVEEAGPHSPRGAVFLHGSALRTDAWHYQIGGIGEHRLVFFDLRGHGLSQPKGDAEYRIPTLARDLEAVIDDSGLEEVVVVGHSVGGMVALELCRSRPELLNDKVRGIVLVNTTHRPAVETLPGGAAIARLERMTRRPFDLIGTQSVRIDQLRRIIRPSDAIFWGVALAAFGRDPSAKQVDFTYDMLAETPGDVIFDLIKSYRDFDVSDDLDDMAVPALVIAGSRDRLTVPKASRYMADHLPKAELVELEGCGHMAMLERHREFNTMLQRFFDDTLGTPAQHPRRRSRNERPKDREGSRRPGRLLHRG